jgi:hypothetical protein
LLFRARSDNFGAPVVIEVQNRNEYSNLFHLICPWWQLLWYSPSWALSVCAFSAAKLKIHLARRRKINPELKLAIFSHATSKPAFWGPLFKIISSFLLVDATSGSCSFKI